MNAYAPVSAGCAETVDPCGVSREEFICQAMKLLPKGSLWARPECDFYKLFTAVAATYYDQWQRICALRIEASPCTADTTLQEWASIFEPVCEGLPDDPQALRDILCQLIQSRGVLSCEFVRATLEGLGYQVISCGPNTEREEMTFTPSCGPALGLSPIGNFWTGMSDSCEDKFKDNPCAIGCCEEDFEQSALEDPDPCEIISNGAFCPLEQCNIPLTPLVGDLQGGEPYQPLKKPFTLDVIIDANSPALEGECYGMTPGSVMLKSGAITSSSGGCSFLDLKICAIDALKPAHLTINYIVDC